MVVSGRHHGFLGRSGQSAFDEDSFAVSFTSVFVIDAPASRDMLDVEDANRGCDI